MSVDPSAAIAQMIKELLIMFTLIGFLGGLVPGMIVAIGVGSILGALAIAIFGLVLSLVGYAYSKFVVRPRMRRREIEFGELDADAGGDA